MLLRGMIRSRRRHVPPGLEVVVQDCSLHSNAFESEFFQNNRTTQDTMSFPIGISSSRVWWWCTCPEEESCHRRCGKPVIETRYLFLCLASCLDFAAASRYPLSLPKCKRTMTGLSLQSIVSFNLHLGHQPSHLLARHVASAFDTLQSDLGESLKAAGSSSDASTYRSWP